jgi:hypothetical protein
VFRDDESPLGKISSVALVARPCPAHGSLGPCDQTIEARKDSAAVSVREFSPTSAGETGREGCSPYKMSSPCSLLPTYLDGVYGRSRMLVA